jgi:cytoplasmic iron level regulating protein YaaA (DUF328/UPF0246 family)
MIALLSPAKSLDYDSPIPATPATRPRFEAEAGVLAAAAAKLGKKKLGALMHISDALATLNDQRFKGFADQPERPAIHAFDGDVYTGFDVATLDDSAIDFAQDHVRILSGLYGLLRPLDAMRPYRLEMGTRWAPRKKALTDWWGTRVADLLAQDLEAEGSGVVINLASQEYFAAVDGMLPSAVRVVDVDFREPGPNGPRFVSFHAKKARGLLARWLVEHRVSDVAGMKDFDSAGYRFDPDESTDDRWRFTRA